MPNRNWIQYLVLMFLITFGIFACAGYPGEPRNPQVGDDAYTVEEDGFLDKPLEEGVLRNDKPREGTQNILVTVGEIETSEGGMVVLAEDGSFTYEPVKNFYGTDQATYTVKNNKNKQSDGVIAFTVTPVNDPPQPVNDHMEISDDQAATINVLENDIEPDGEEIQVVQVQEPNTGSVVIEDNGAITYTPQPNHSGDVSFSYTVADSSDEQATAWVFLTISDINNGISLQPDTITVPEDSPPTTFPISLLLENDTGIGLTVIELGQAQSGTVVHNGQTFSYAPDANFSGEDTFTYTVQAQNGNTASSTVTVRVTGDSDAPTISDIADQTAREGNMAGPIHFTVEDLDTPASDLSVTAAVSNVTPPNLLSNDNIIIRGNSEHRTLWIVLGPNLTGSATITVTVSDGQAQASESFLLNVTSANAPVISYIWDQSTAINTPITVTFWVRDRDTPPMNLIVTANSSNQALVPDGNLEVTAADFPRSLRITPAANQEGTTTITINASDGVNSSTRSFYLEVSSAARTSTSRRSLISNNSRSLSSTSPSSSSPGAVYTTSEDTPITISGSIEAPANDTAATEDSSLIQTSLYGGEVQIGSNGEFNYTPPANFSGQDQFQYGAPAANDNDADSSGQVSITVTEVNDKPLAENDIYSVLPGEELVVSKDQGVLANDRDVEDHPMKVTAKTYSHLSIHEDGSFSYTSPSGFSDREVFTYSVTDGSDYSTATLTLSAGSNLAPVVRQDTYTISKGQMQKFTASKGLLTNDKDPEGQQLTISETGVFDTLFGGEVNVESSGGFTYLPPPNFDGFDSFTYTVTDGQTVVTGVATISVSPK